jgi:RHS repeat-associated protein
MTPTNTPTPTTPPVPVFSQADFTYDGDGHRVKSVMQTNIASTTTYFVSNYYEVTDGVVTKYYYAGSQRIAMRKNGTLNYIIGDHLGSTSLMTDAAGVIVSQQQYKAWGETRSATGSEVTKYQYTGQYSYAADFGLQFYNARWYDSSLGRFAQADTIVPGGVQGYDRYAYVNNNPLLYNDPTGHCGNYYEDTYSLSCQPTLGLGAGLNGSDNGINEPGPTWHNQMASWRTDRKNMLFGLPTYTAEYPGTANIDDFGKQGEAERLRKANKNPAAPTTLICMSAGSEACMLYLQYRLQNNHKTTSVVLIGPTWSNETRDGFNAWTDIIDAALRDGTNILVVNDASLAELPSQYQSPKSYSVPGQKGTYTLGEVPYSQPAVYPGSSVLPHHSSKCGVECIGANNSSDLVFSVYNFINSNIWSWNPATP